MALEQVPVQAQEREQGLVQAQEREREQGQVLAPEQELGLDSR